MESSIENMHADLRVKRVKNLASFLEYRPDIHVLHFEISLGVKR